MLLSRGWRIAAVAVVGAIVIVLMIFGVIAPSETKGPESAVLSEADGLEGHQSPPTLAEPKAFTPVGTRSRVSRPGRERASNVPDYDAKNRRTERERAARTDLSVNSSQQKDWQERVRLMQPTESELRQMSSRDLAQELATSPLAISNVHFTNPNARMRRFATDHGGVDILFGRPDAGQAILETYREYGGLIGSPPGSTSVELGGFAMSFAYLESLLSADEVLGQFQSEEAKREVVVAIVNSVEERAAYDASRDQPLYGEVILEYAAVAAGKYLRALSYPPFMSWLNAQNDPGLLSERSPNYDRTLEILDIAYEFVEVSAPSS